MKLNLLKDNVLRETDLTWKLGLIRLGKKLTYR